MTLTEAAFWTRRLGVLAIGFFGVLVLATIVFLAWPESDPLPNYLQADFMCTPTATQFAESRLTLPSLQLASGSEPIFEIDTTTGTLGDLPLIANVYRYSNPSAILSAQNEAKKIATRFGFDPEAIQRSSTHYFWSEDSFGRSLQVEIATLNFRMTSDFTNTTVFPDEGSLPTSQEAQSIATSFLRSGGWLLEDYNSNEPITIDINIEPDGSFSEARSRSEAELIRVDFVRSKPFVSLRADLEGSEVIKERLEEEYETYPATTRILETPDGKVDVYDFNTVVVHQDTQKSNISVYIGVKDSRKKSEDGPQQIYGVDYTGWIIDTDACGTYPLISASELTTKIENGEGALVYLNERNGDDVIPYQPRRVSKFSIKQVQIGYLDQLSEQEYLQPVYIVTGEATMGTNITGTFYYYVPAIDYTNLRDPIIEEAVVQ